MKQPPRTPKPGLEILVARLVNSLSEDQKFLTDEQLKALDEAKLFEYYGEQNELPNKAAQMNLNGDRYQQIEAELKKILAGELTNTIDFTDPPAVKAYLDRFVEGVEEAKEVLAIGVVDYLQHKLRKGIVYIGPSGSGKTYLWETIAKALKIPFVKMSLANLSGEGYKGQNLSERLADLLGKEKGILFLDEIDKIANGASGLENSFELKLQNEILAYFTGEKVKLNAPPVFMENPEDQNSPEQEKNPENPTEESEEDSLPKITIYCARQSVVVPDPQNNPVRRYLDSLVQYFRDNFLPWEYRDLTSGFENVPQEVTQILKNPDGQQEKNKEQGWRGRRGQRRFDYWGENFPVDAYGQPVNNTEIDIDAFCTFVVQVGKNKDPAKNKFLINPKRSDLNQALGIGPEKNEEKEPEKKDPNQPLIPKKKMKLREMTNEVDMGKILVVTAGAFHGHTKSPSLYRIIQKRLGGNTCKLDETELLRGLEDEDLIEYGLKPELVARLDCRAGLKPQSVEGLFRILKYKENSPLDQIRNIFEEIGVTLTFDDPVMLLLAEYASEGIGVRGIHKVLNELTQNLSFHRRNYVGQTFPFRRSELEKRLKKQILFEKIDNYEIDWFDIHSILNYLNFFVPHQEEAKQEIAQAFHLYHIWMSDRKQKGRKDLPISNLMLVGPTGSGKTYMSYLLAKKGKMPIASTNATGKVNEGVFGTRLADVVEQFSERQQYGIIYIDEVDKIVMDRNHPLTNELIGMLENGEVRGRKTENYMFILSGAFQQIFNDQKKSGQASPKITREDLEKYGVRDELLGRIPLIANLTPPTLETMTQVLDGPDSVLTKYANYFSTKGYALELEPGVAEIICRKALEFNKGFRALPTVCRKLFGEYMIHLARYVQPEGDKLLVKLEDAHNILEVPKYDPPREPLKFPGTGYN